MKNKKITYSLLILTVMIWGYILWEIVSQGGKSPQTPVLVQKTNEVKQDTFELLLNYRDPFFEKQLKTTEIKKRLNDPISRDLPEEKTPDFVYKGIIASKKKTYAVIYRNNEEILFSKGDRIDEYNIVRYDNDELIVVRKGKIYKLRIE